MSSAPRRGFWSDLRANLLVGLRVFFFRRVQPADIVSSFDQVVALLAILLAIAALLDRATAGGDAEFTYYGLYAWLALLLMGFWACALISRVRSANADTRPLLIVGLSTAPWALVLLSALSFVPWLADDSMLFAGAMIVVVLWASLRAVRAAYGGMQPVAPVIIVVSMLGIALANTYLYFDTHLWSAPLDDEADESSAPAWQEAESVFFEQPALIDEAIERLEPQRPGITDFYYLGFAGDGAQRVFRREALFGQKVFAERLGTGPRSLELINDYEDRDAFPLGTITGLRYALSQMSRVMDPEEDVLILFLTSHGSQEGGLAIQNGIAPLTTDLPPDELRSALDDAGIRWRIVIVSACYSGIFVEPLKSDTTMILTAADSQHTSFGCADDRELTYFGEAFLQDSLPGAPSLEAAFEHARREIARREAEEKLEPSNPQIWVGASMSRKLQELGALPLSAPPERTRPDRRGVHVGLPTAPRSRS